MKNGCGLPVMRRFLLPIFLEKDNEGRGEEILESFSFSASAVDLKRTFPFLEHTQALQSYDDNLDWFSGYYTLYCPGQ
jgi:hypothetical protein